VKPVYLDTSGGHTVAAIYEPATGTPKGTGVLLVPPFGWDDQTSYRPRRDWSLALAASGFANLRIDLPGTGDSSGGPRDDDLIDAWTQSVTSGIDWLRSAGAERIAVIALGVGGLVTLQVIARGAIVDDLVLWGVPAAGRSLVREIRAFGRLEQSQTGEPSDETAEGELRAGGHVLAAETVSALSALDSVALLASGAPSRALVLGRDGTGPDEVLLGALRSAGAEVRSDPGRGWGAALARPQSTSPLQIFQIVSAWLSERAPSASQLSDPPSRETAEINSPAGRVRETAIVFEGASQQLYAILAEPLDAPVAKGTIILFNAGAIRRIGPNRMWTEAARRWAVMGVPVIRVDVEGIGDAGGDGTKYIESDDPFYTQALIDQSRAALDLATERGLPQTFLLGGLCSGGFWAFQLALTDPRVRGIMALNPRLLIFDPDAEGRRELRGLRRIVTAKGFRNMLLEKQKLVRLWRLMTFLQKLPTRLLRRRGRTAADELSEALSTVHRRGQRIDMVFSGEEPLYQELREQPGLKELNAMGINFYEVPYTSHTLKPLKAQKLAHAILDEIVERTFHGE
jgi:pimeloyl-ACP methyl ester carboxylesterase